MFSQWVCGYQRNAKCEPLLLIPHASSFISPLSAPPPLRAPPLGEEDPALLSSPSTKGRSGGSAAPARSSPGLCPRGGRHRSVLQPVILAEDIVHVKLVEKKEPKLKQRDSPAPSDPLSCLKF
ncbi:unnamed protein product [Arctogadus glacialis]